MPIPTHLDNGAIIHLRDRSSGEMFVGKHLDVQSKKCVEFALPVLENRQLDIVAD